MVASDGLGLQKSGKKETGSHIGWVAGDEALV
jgi:hypothetical protein